MSGHHLSSGPFPGIDSDDPLAMMGVAMVGMTLQELAEQEERRRRASLTPWQRAAEDRRNAEMARRVWLVLGIFGVLCIAGLSALIVVNALAGILSRILSGF